MSVTGAKEARIGILDPLRFIAAMWVMFYHYLPFIKSEIGSESFNFFKYGYLGVNFFFMLSGFVIMASAQNRSAIRFGLLRALRLYPAFIACLLITLIVLFFLKVPLPSVSAILLNGLIINDYFGVPNVDNVYWTLQAELKFYACIFLVIFIGGIHHYKWWLSIWLVMAICHHFIKQPFFMGWFISPTYSFYFIGGVASYLIFNDRKNKYALGVFLVAMVFAMTKSWDQINGFVSVVNHNDRVFATLLTATFFVFFILLRNLNKYFSSTRLMVMLGGMSYPLYLLHSRAGGSILKFLNESIGSVPSLIITIFTVLAVSLAVHVMVEKPLFRAVRHKVN
jgi:peptidoglycan/LPS O-acetylase OafA/YrhL